MHTFFDSKFALIVVLVLFTSAFAWNGMNAPKTLDAGQVLMAPADGVLIAHGPTFPPDPSDGVLIAA